MSKVQNTPLNTTTADTMSKMSAVYMDGVVRLSALGFGTCREAFEAFSVASSAALSESKGGQPMKYLPIMLGQSALDKSVAYARGASEIIASTQEQLSRAMFEQLARINIGANLPEGWSEMGDLFTKGCQQFTENAAENVRAASEAGSEAVARLAQQARRAA